MPHHEKLAWAAKHLESLDAEMSAFVKENPFTARVAIDRQRNTIRVLANEYPPVPAPWSLLLGDAIQNTRSALDHIVYALAAKATAPAAPAKEWEIQFPITTDLDDYFGSVSATGIRKEKGGKRYKHIRLLEPLAQTVIDGLQPHLGSKLENLYLSRIAELSNQDKHRQILILAAACLNRQTQFQGFDGPVLDRMSIESGIRTAKRNTEIAVYTFHEPLPSSEVHVNPVIEGEFAFGPLVPGEQVNFVVQSVREAHHFIRTKVFEPLDKFL